MFHRRLSLAPPRTLPWPLKPLESAQTSLSYDEFGRMVMRIRHEVLTGLTPEMSSPPSRPMISRAALTRGCATCVSESA